MSFNSVFVTEKQEVEIEEGDNDDVPDVRIRDKLTKDFVLVTNTNEACAKLYLQDRKWDLECSVNAFLEDCNERVKDLKVSDGNEVEVENIQDKPTTSNAESLVNSTATKANNEATEYPKILKFITWNIDSVRPEKSEIRTKAVVDWINYSKADVIFFQEVSPRAEEYLRDNLKNYNFLFGGDEEYYTGLAYNPNTIEYDNHSVEDFTNSAQDRNLLLFKANMGGCKILFMNSHLESLREGSGERMNQLKIAFQRMTKSHSSWNVIFAGDVNLRDSELSRIGGIPNGVNDAWISCGQKEKWAYTWDMLLNDSLPEVQTFTHIPRMRLDRIYYKVADEAPIRATDFKLIGLSRIQPYNVFPSDHFGILCFFSLNGKSFKK